jgi:glycosyltransferase involved in cell wall biosynthesis
VPVTGRRIDLVFPRFKLLSGAERLILEFSAALARAGQHPRIVCHQFDESCRPLLAPGVELAVSGARLDWFPNRYLNAAFDYARVFALRRTLDPRADALVLFGPALQLAWYLRVLRRDRRPTVYHCFEPPRVLHQDRDTVLDHAGAARLPLRLALAAYRWIDRRLIGSATEITTAGPFAVRRFQEVYGRPAHSLAHGVDRTNLERHGDVRPQPGRLVTVNYLHPRKRVDMAIRALALLDEPTPDGCPVTLEVVGDGPERAALERLATHLGVGDRVSFTGFIDESDLAAHYRAAACYVHMTREETFGLSLIEASYCGLPVVAVAEGGPVDNVEDGVTGHLTESTPEGLAAGVREVLWSADGGREMGAAGHQLVARVHTWDRGAAQLLELIERAL